MLGVVLFFSALCGMKAEHQTSVPPVKAGNFTYTLGSGQKDSLYALTSEWILLYFYEPMVCAMISGPMPSPANTAILIFIVV